MTIQEAYKFCIYCGTKADLVDNNHLKCSKCGKSYFFSPSIGAAAFCRNSKGEIVVIERNIEPHKGTLGLPAGFIDITDQSIEDALERELMEEIGVNVKNIKYLSSHHTIYPFAGVERPHMSTFWVCYIEGDQELSLQQSEVSKAFFADIKTVDLNSFGFISTKEAIADYIATQNGKKEKEK